MVTKCSTEYQWYSLEMFESGRTVSDTCKAITDIPIIKCFSSVFAKIITNNKIMLSLKSA